MTDMTGARAAPIAEPRRELPRLVPGSIQLVPAEGPGIPVAEWEARARHVADLLAEDEFPPDQLPDVLRELSLRDVAGRAWCFDGTVWWGWDGTAWAAGAPDGILQLLPFTMESLVEDAPTSPRYLPTHRVPDAGLPAWSRPDPALQPEHALDPGLDVMVIEQRPDGWAHVRFSNEWDAWVDGRLLVPGQ